MKKYIIYLFLVPMLISIFSCSEDKIDTLGAGILTGTVIEQGTNEPIENVKVTIVSSNVSVLTNATGDFVLNNVQVGEQSISAKKNGYLASFEAITMVSGGSLTLILEMSIETTNNDSPSQPELVSPDDNAIDLELSVDLSWTSTDPEEDELIFKIELRNDQDSDLLIFDDIMDETFTLTQLNYGVRYFWQVSVSDGINPEVWSTTRSFSTVDTPNHRFLFTRKISGNGIVFSGGFDSNNDPVELQLTSSSNNSWRTRKNNNTGLIAFLRSNGVETHLYSMNPDGSNIQQITNTVPVSGFDLEQIDFCWSNNGAKLLYTNFDKLYSINRDGSGLTLVYQTLDGSFISECDITVDESMIALKTNDVNGYNISVFTINMSGTILNTVLSGVNGAAGGLNFSVDNSKLLYTHDVSGYESVDQRQLDTHIFIYDFGTTTATDLSQSKPVGFLDLDPRFSPNEAEVIYTHTSNDEVSENKIQSLNIASVGTRNDLFLNANMPDWE
ncbi:MAG: carboxypeptidase regulatory-like domain-containing protein [Flavobacteriaceae bacterium]|nr:carboxypeptidase regulatory-like domain-containing protein [Flavobacteriaceae bacterium]